VRVPERSRNTAKFLSGEWGKQAALRVCVGEWPKQSTRTGAERGKSVTFRESRRDTLPHTHTRTLAQWANLFRRRIALVVAAAFAQPPPHHSHTPSAQHFLVRLRVFFYFLCAVAKLNGFAANSGGIMPHTQRQSSLHRVEWAWAWAKAVCVRAVRQ